jgi:LPS export ABC transporter protein LptC
MVRKKKVFLMPGGRSLILPAFLFLFPAIVVLTAGCTEDSKPKTQTPREKTDPLLSAKDIEVTFSDSGRISAKIYGPVVNRYEGKTPYMEFPKGFRIYIYDISMRVETSIKGNYGIRFENTHIMEARGHVVVKNEIKNQQLETEHLIWDEAKGRIYSDVKAKITTPEKLLYAEGLESNESFTWYRFTSVTGEMTIKKDSL